LDPLQQLIVDDYGNWSLKQGLHAYRNEPKMRKRQNLRGHHFMVVTAESPPYTTEMIPIPNAPGTYMPKGMFADVFYGLQVVILLCILDFT